ncbi:MAG TPA: glycosyltransferase family 9 protein [Gemmatimonadota bacterium]|nr:glycosyltransferase family 9 protein [Gemmatimonadota bacterium]
MVRVPNWIGDAILALPAVAALVDRFHPNGILVVARPHIAPLFAGLEGIEEVVRIAHRGPTRFAQARKHLAPRRPALGVTFVHSLGGAAELSAGSVVQVWGYGGLWRRLATDVRLPRRWIRDRHRWEVYALLAAAVTGRPVAERYPLAVGPGDVAHADRLFQDTRLQDGAPRVGLVPGAHAASRRWPVERFAELASRLGRDGIRVILFGSNGERALTARVAGGARPEPIDWAGLTPLPVLAECFRRIDFLVTNDTGPMHLAAAAGTPLLDLCGAADERVTGPRGPASLTLVHPVHCRPCVKNACAYNLECMRGIDVDTVHRVVGARLGREALALGSSVFP